jgi:hypothetical protein
MLIPILVEKTAVVSTLGLCLGGSIIRKIMEGCLVLLRSVFPKYAVNVETYDFKRKKRSFPRPINRI